MAELVQEGSEIFIPLTDSTGYTHKYQSLGSLEFQGEEYQMFIDETGDYLFGWWHGLDELPLDAEDLNARCSASIWPRGVYESVTGLAAAIDAATK